MSVMREAGISLLIVISIALLVAVAVLVFGVGRIVFGIARYYFHERKPERQFQHPEFGVFTSNSDLWSCELHRDGRELRLLVGGTESAPSERLLVQAQSILGRFAKVEQQAAEFLRIKEEELRTATLDFYCLEITDKQRPDDFTFEFVDPRDDSRAWRVEFVAGEPRHTGFDD
jgi:hypothetical protein